MNKRSGFTLIELLVVIAIIALLMAVLMPAMARVRAQAKASACLSNLHQWGFFFQMYAEDNGGMLGDGNWTGTFDSGRAYREWVNFLRPYYKNNYKFCLCPMATRPWSRGARGKWSAWGIFPGVCPYDGVDWESERPGYEAAMALGAWEPEYPGDRGSYGTNHWCYGLPEDEEKLIAKKMASGRPLDHAWKTIHVKNAGTIPLMLDANWIFGTPTHNDEPPLLEASVVESAGADDNMRRFTINRHNGYVNAAFLDFSARPVGIKELWILKWSRKYIIDGDPAGAIQTIQTLGWPPWMTKFKEYFSLTPS